MADLFSAAAGVDWGQRSCYPAAMSPTVFQEKGYRFFFFSREEPRMHVHVSSSEGDAKFWLEPTVEVALCRGLPDHQVNEIRRIIDGRKEELIRAWHEHICG